jgi:hypothetical protein
MSPDPPAILDYHRPGPARRRAALIRWGMFALAIVAFLTAAVLALNPVLQISESLGGGILGTPLAPISKSLIDDQSNSDGHEMYTRYLPDALAYLGVFLIAQWFFLCPRGSFRFGVSLEGPPSRRAAVAAGFIGMLLSVGLLATLMELPNWWLRLTAEGDVNTPQHFFWMWIVMAILWIAWTVVFHSYWRGLDRYTALRKAFRWLLAGTVLELLVAAPAHALIVQKRGNDCYCERGTWTGVAFGCTAALWLFGPGTFLLFLREKQRCEELV